MGHYLSHDVGKIRSAASSRSPGNSMFSAAPDAAPVRNLCLALLVVCFCFSVVFVRAASITNRARLAHSVFGARTIAAELRFRGRARTSARPARPIASTIACRDCHRFAAGRPYNFLDFLTSTVNVSPTGPVARLNNRSTNPARFSAILIPRSV